jgi:hypothetical protein
VCTFTLEDEHDFGHELVVSSNPTTEGIRLGQEVNKFLGEVILEAVAVLSCV